MSDPATAPTISRSVSAVPGASSGWAELAEVLATCHRRLRPEVARVSQLHGVSESQFSLLWHLRAAPKQGVGQSQLAASLGLSAAHVSGSVDQLRERGLLVGRRCEFDRRRQLWRLSLQGRATLEAILEDLKRSNRWPQQQVPPSSCAGLRAYLGSLASALGSPVNPVGSDGANGGGTNLSDSTHPQTIASPVSTASNVEGALR